MSRSLAEIMPTDTLPPSPNGLPMAITQSPTFSLLDEPNATCASGRLGVTFKSARSVLVSLPSTFSATSLEPLLKLMVISSAPSMTWLLVTIRPSLPSITKPEPCAATLRSGSGPPLRSKNSSKNSSNGAFLGTLGSRSPSIPFSVCLVVMLTTASMSLSATGATLGGPGRLCARAGANSTATRQSPRHSAGAIGAALPRAGATPAAVSARSRISDRFGLVMAKSPIRSAPPPASAPRQPDDNHPRGHRAGSGRAEHGFGQLRGRREQSDPQLRRGRPQQALDHQHESSADQQVIHFFGVPPGTLPPFGLLK